MLESKRQNKLLKLAIQRLQNQISSQAQVATATQKETDKLRLLAGSADDYAEAAGDTFLTESQAAPRASSVPPADEGKQGVSHM